MLKDWWIVHTHIANHHIKFMHSTQCWRWHLNTHPLDSRSNVLIHDLTQSHFSFVYEFKDNDFFGIHIHTNTTINFPLSQWDRLESFCYVKFIEFCWSLNIITFSSSPCVCSSFHSMSMNTTYEGVDLLVYHYAITITHFQWIL